MNDIHSRANREAAQSTRQLRPLANFRTLATLAGLAILAVAACDCDPVNVGSVASKIEVEPNPVVISGIPGAGMNVRLEVKNSGNASLSLLKAPYFIEHDDDGVDEFGVVSLFEKDCKGLDRTASNAASEIEPGGCAVLVFRYEPNSDGVDNATLRFESNASNNTDGYYDVEIQASAFTPALEVCAFDGDTDLGCWDPKDGLFVDFDIVTPGVPTERRLELRSTGSRAVNIGLVEIEGDVDYSFSPDPFEKEIAPGESADLMVLLDAVVGGIREAQLAIHSNDPRHEIVYIDLMGQGDGPGLCMCVNIPGERCVRATSVADFGGIMPGSTGARVLHVSSCGTKDLSISALDLANDRNAFGADLPALPLTLAPGESEQIDLSFSPADYDSYAGRLNFGTNLEGSIAPFLSLRGEGVESRCRLVPSETLVNFGDVGEGISAKRYVDLFNTGSEYCNISDPAVVETLSGGDFALASSPPIPAPVAPGDRARFEVSFTPNSASGQSTGTFKVGYGVDEAGAAQMQIEVNLMGSATERGPCKIVAQPGEGSSSPIPGFPMPGLGGRSLPFGNVRIGHEKILSVDLQNVGGDVCQITSAKIAPGMFPLPELDNSNEFRIVSMPRQVLQPGDSTEVVVAFKPTMEREELPSFGFGQFLPSLQVGTSDHTSYPDGCAGSMTGGAPGAICWDLTGNGVKADILVVPSQIDFGLVTLGCGSGEQRITIYNIGGDKVTVNSTMIEPADAAQYFRVQGGVSPGGNPVVIPVGGQRDLRVRFIPPPGGPAQPHVGSLRILSDATNLPDVLVSLDGAGTTESHQTDTFTQAEKSSADVLFVVDDSGSMSGHQSHLGSQAEAFLRVALEKDTDFHIGVVTTDTHDDKLSGKFQGNPKIINNHTPNAAAALRKTVNDLGTNGSGIERGFHAMSLALSEPLISNENQGFLREDANLAVIIVSDEEDQSPGSVNLYLDFLHQIKGTHNAHMVKLHSIVGDPGSGCKGNGDADPGDRYVHITNATNGLFQSICVPDWAEMAEKMGMDIFDGFRGYRLSRVLDPDHPYDVKVNGSPSPTNHWSYDANTNNIVFGVNHIPAPGAEIEVSYEAYCFDPN